MQQQIIALLLDNWVGLAILAVILLVLAGYKGRGLVDFLRGLKPIKEGWGNLVEKVDTIAKDVDFLMQTAKIPLRNKFSESRSPRQLNENGKRVARLVDAEKLVGKYASQIEIGENESAYSIQQKCFEFALEKLPALLTQEETKLIEDTAFDEGVEKSAIFDAIIGISLRNKILSDRRIPLERVDETHPKAQKI